MDAIKFIPVISISGQSAFGDLKTSGRPEPESSSVRGVTGTISLLVVINASPPSTVAII